MDMFRKQAGECNIIITTAAIPGRPAPTLIKKEAVDNMKPGSVIVDLFSPLMSTSNSLSGVVILGGVLMASTDTGSATNVLGCSAIAVSSLNVWGGFAVSYRMLNMFKKERSTHS